MLRSKTMWFALLLAVLSAVQASIGAFDAVLSPQMAGIVGLIISIAVGVLRVLTTQPLAEK